MNVLSRVFLSGGPNAVPLSGWFLGGWSAGTALAFFWFENLLLALVIAVRIAVHWRATRTRGHTGGFLGTFLVTTLGFTAVHGVFLTIALTKLLPESVDRADLESGVLWLAGTQVASLGFDMWGIRRWPFAEIRQRVDWVMGRIVVVHLGLLAGMWLLIALDQPERFFVVFLVLKAMTDIGTLLPKWQWRPQQPPAWLLRPATEAPRTAGRSEVCRRAGRAFVSGPG